MSAITLSPELSTLELPPSFPSPSSGALPPKLAPSSSSVLLQSWHVDSLPLLPSPPDPASVFSSTAWEPELDAEWDQDLTILVLWDGVLEWEQDLDVKGIGEQRMAEPVGEAILLGLGASGPAPLCMHASLWDNRLAAWACLSR